MTLLDTPKPATGDAADLDALFAPRVIALVGASDDPYKIGGRPLRYMMEAGSEVRIHPVNPTRDTVQGIKAYASVSDIPEQSVELLQDLDIWIVDALRDNTHISHFSVDQALEWIARIRPRRAVLTNMHVDLDYEALNSRLPETVVPAYDGMRLELPSEDNS